MDEPTSTSKQRTVAAVVVTWNSSGTIQACLTSLVSELASYAADIRVFDNHSADDTALLAQECLGGVGTVTVNSANLGLAAANNQGIRGTDSEIVLICNPDIELRPGAVDELLTCLDAHPRAGAVVARLEHEDGSLQTSAGSLPSLREALLGRRLGLRGSRQGAWWHEWPHDEERQIGRGQEACYVVRRTAIDEVGPQDPGYWLDWEGVDWARRMAEAGWELWFCPTAHVFHAGGVSIKQAPLRWVRSSHVGMYRYFSRGRSLPERLALMAVVVARGLVKAAFTLRPESLYERGHR